MNGKGLGKVNFCPNMEEYIRRKLFLLHSIKQYSFKIIPHNYHFHNKTYFKVVVKIQD